MSLTSVQQTLIILIYIDVCPKEAICEMSQIGNLKHLRKNGILNFPKQSNNGGLLK